KDRVEEATQRDLKYDGCGLIRIVGRALGWVTRLSDWLLGALIFCDDLLPFSCYYMYACFGLGLGSFFLRGFPARHSFPPSLRPFCLCAPKDWHGSRATKRVALGPPMKAGLGYTDILCCLAFPHVGCYTSAWNSQPKCGVLKRICVGGGWSAGIRLVQWFS
ncbi:unnamed protein product, partial [Discosporangium mesarthrocarpum]